MVWLISENLNPQETIQLRAVYSLHNVVHTTGAITPVTRETMLRVQNSVRVCMRSSYKLKAAMCQLVF